MLFTFKTTKMDHCQLSSYSLKIKPVKFDEQKFKVFINTMDKNYFFYFLSRYNI